MDDLDNYRRRIGTFISTHHSASRINTLHRGKDNATSFIFKVAFLVCFSLPVFCSTQDPSIAKNPGPRQRDTPFPYTTAQEKTLFLQIRKLHEDRININSHTLFLQNCLNNRLVPKVYFQLFPQQWPNQTRILITNSNSCNKIIPSVE